VKSIMSICTTPQASLLHVKNPSSEGRNMNLQCLHTATESGSGGSGAQTLSNTSHIFFFFDVVPLFFLFSLKIKYSLTP
jgi:hypothetical protein